MYVDNTGRYNLIQSVSYNEKSRKCKFAKSNYSVHAFFFFFKNFKVKIVLLVKISARGPACRR